MPVTRTASTNAVTRSSGASAARPDAGVGAGAAVAGGTAAGADTGAGDGFVATTGAALVATGVETGGVDELGVVDGEASGDVERGGGVVVGATTALVVAAGECSNAAGDVIAGVVTVGGVEPRICGGTIGGVAESAGAEVATGALAVEGGAADATRAGAEGRLTR